jgi:hypothetical protein
MRKGGRLLGPRGQGGVRRLHRAVLRGLRAPRDGFHAGGAQVRRLHWSARGRVEAERAGPRLARAAAAAQRGGGGARHEERARVHREPAAPG